MLNKQEGTLETHTNFDGTNIDYQLNKMKGNTEHFQIVADCPVRNVLDRFGDKWSVLVLMVLHSEDVMRFNQLNHAIGDVSQKMLTVTLRSLEADGLVSRKIYPEIPPRVEYQLTGLGKSLIPHINALASWSKQHMPVILKTRKKFEAKKVA